MGILDYFKKNTWYKIVSIVLIVLGVISGLLLIFFRVLILLSLVFLALGITGLWYYSKNPKKLTKPVGTITVSGPYSSENGIPDGPGIIDYSTYKDTYGILYGKIGVRSVQYKKDDPTVLDPETYSDINWNPNSYIFYKITVPPTPPTTKIGFSFLIPTQEVIKSGTYYQFVGSFYKTRVNNVLSDPIKDLQEIHLAIVSAIEPSLLVNESDDPLLNKLLQ